MIQHKFFIKYDGDWNTFDKMKRNGQIIREYEIFAKKQIVMVEHIKAIMTKIIENSYTQN